MELQRVVEEEKEKEKEDNIISVRPLPNDCALPTFLSEYRREDRVFTSPNGLQIAFPVRSTAKDPFPPSHVHVGAFEKEKEKRGYSYGRVFHSDALKEGMRFSNMAWFSNDLLALVCDESRRLPNNKLDPNCQLTLHIYRNSVRNEALRKTLLPFFDELDGLVSIVLNMVGFEDGRSILIGKAKGFRKPFGKVTIAGMVTNDEKSSTGRYVHIFIGGDFVKKSIVAYRLEM